MRLRKINLSFTFGHYYDICSFTVSRVESEFDLYLVNFNGLYPALGRLHFCDNFTPMKIMEPQAKFPQPYLKMQ